MSKKSFNKNFKQTNEQIKSVVTDENDVVATDSSSNEEVGIQEEAKMEEILDNNEIELKNEAEEKIVSDSVESEVQTSEIVDEITAPIVLEDPDIDFTVESKNKPKEEKELDDVINDIKNIIEPAVEDINKAIEDSKSKLNKPNDNKPSETSKQRKITFEKMFGYFWNGQNYNF